MAAFILADFSTHDSESGTDIIACISGTLSVLYSAAQTYAGSHAPITHIGIAIPVDLSDAKDSLRNSWRAGILDASLQDAGLPPPEAGYDFAPHAASRANGIGDCSKGQPCEVGRDHNPQTIVLAIQYSQATLSVAITISYSGRFRTFRHTSSAELGARKVHDRETDHAQYWEDVQSSSRSLLM